MYNSKRRSRRGNGRAVTVLSSVHASCVADLVIPGWGSIAVPAAAGAGSWQTIMLGSLLLLAHFSALISSRL